MTTISQYVEVEIDLHEIDTYDLIEELRRRDDNDFRHVTKEVIEETALEAATILKKHGDIAMANRLEEIYRKV